ncbi:MAG: amidohydrolase [Clostridia bacterium]|nr:amidohydrolase [Clostridia bacterium]
MLDFITIRTEAEALQSEAVECYRYLHRHPETAHHEVETNRFIRRELDRLGIPYDAPADNVTIAVVDSGLPGPVVGLRCDTDALPVQEETGLPFASETPGVMHACGHDAHITSGLFAARLLNAHKGEWKGKLKVIFQPAEEGEGGARDLIKTGAADGIDAFFGIHVWSPHPSGGMYASASPVSASVDMFTIRIHGKGGHGATPDLCHDAVVAASALVIQLQTAVSRCVSPMQPALLTIGSFHAGTVGNIIAEDAELKGTIRAFDAKTRKTLVDTLHTMADLVCRAHGCTAEVNNIDLTPAVINHPQAAEVARRACDKLFGEGTVRNQSALMLGDDFADYMALAPSCYAQVGIADEAKATHYAHHNCRFKVDEDVLWKCAAWMAAFVLEWNQ